VQRYSPTAPRCADINHVRTMQELLRGGGRTLNERLTFLLKR
jgi:hypothetical protein